MLIIGFMALWAAGLCFFAGLFSKPMDSNGNWAMAALLWPIAVPLLVLVVVAKLISDQLFDWGENFYEKYL